MFSDHHLLPISVPILRIPDEVFTGISNKLTQFSFKYILSKESKHYQAICELQLI